MAYKGRKKEKKVKEITLVVEKEYWETIKFKDPVSGKLRKQKVKIVRYKQPNTLPADIEEKDPLLEKIGALRKYKRDY